MAPEPLLSLRDVAARLGVCTETARKLIHQGALPHIRVSNAIRVRGSDLESYVSAQTSGETT